MSKDPMFLAPVVHIEVGDVNGSGIESYITGGKKGIIALAAHWCAHCKNMEQAYTQFAKEGKFFAGVIQQDGEEKEALEVFKKVNGVSANGFPSFAGVSADGKFVKMHNGGRSVEDFNKFAESL